MTTGRMLSYVEIDVPATVFTQFGGVSEGEPPLGWELEFGAGDLVGFIDPNAPAGRGIVLTVGPSGIAAYRFTKALDEAPDTSVITGLYNPTLVGDTYMGIFLRGVYFIGISADELGITKEGAPLASEPLELDPANGITWLRADVFTTEEGSVTIRAKVWQGDVADEPVEFNLFAIDDDDPALDADISGIFVANDSAFDTGAGFSLFYQQTLGDEEDTYRFAIPTDYLPAAIEATPSIKSINYQAVAVSLGEDLGRRGTASVVFGDHPHMFFDEQFNVGTFWGKWRFMFGQRLRGRGFRLIQGFEGQALDSMEIRHLIVEKTDGPTPDGNYTVSARDPVKFFDDDRAQAPLLSNGRLAGGIDDDDTAITLSPAGIGDDEYPDAPFYACVGGKEVVLVSARSGDSLTISRGELGSTQIAHDAGDRVQVVLYYPGNTMAEIAYDLIENYTDFNPDLIVFPDWEAEMTNYLPVLFARAITEPTGVSKLLSELIAQSATTIAWDDRANTLRLQVLRGIATDAEVIPEERIVQGSLTVKDQPESRISQHWTYFGQRDPTDRGDNSDNYRAALAEVDLESETQHGGPEIRKTFGSWVPTLTAADRLNQIKMSRFRKPPRKFTFDLFQGHIVQLLGGYRLPWRQNQNIFGHAIETGAPIQITRLSVEPGLIHVEAEEMLASGEIILVNVVIITDPGVTEWEVPEDWNDADNAVHCIGGGGGGGFGTGNGGGGGGSGAAYSASFNLNLTPLDLLPVRAGAPGAPSGNGGDSWFNGASVAGSMVGAKGGLAGTSGNTRESVAGGQASEGVGDVRRSGGEGGRGAPKGDTRAGGGGGGGAGGPNGDGAAGLALFSTNNDGGGGGGAADGGQPATQYDSGDGGDGGNNRFNFGGGTANNIHGQDGGGGKGGVSREANTTGDGGNGEPIWTQTISPIISAGPGGGGGGGGSHDDPGGDGGDFGGGGGGGGGDASQPGGTGGRGCVVIEWTSAEIGS